ncbi:EXT1 [Symbiodinium natans]|uniref:EXT1 protein n=1 Tax=Symbiodinium natans TaxID=878477 RepID=A0A812HV91_9DINO|nr:EXT1 [Symbiodinium natans]
MLERAFALLTFRFADAFVQFFLYPPHFESDGILSTWYSQLYDELQTHPWRTTSPEQASIFFLGIDVSCAYLWPVYSAPVPGAVNYETKARWGTLGDSRTCRESRQARLEAYVRNGWATYWGVAGKQHVVFDQLCYNPVSELVHAHHSVTLAGVGHLRGKAYGYRRNIDIAWPEMPVTVENPEIKTCTCSPRKRLVSFQGAQTRQVRQKLRALHDGSEIVVNVVDVSKSALNTTDARWNNSHPIKAEYAALMRESEFALAPAGHSPCSLRLYEIMSFCAIPVVLSDEKLLPFSEILNWSEMAVIVPENAVATIPGVLRALGPQQRCRMRRRAFEAFHAYFANVSSNVRGLLEVLELHANGGFRANEDSQKLASDFREQSSTLAWSPYAMEDFRRQRLALQWLPASPPSLPNGDCFISWDAVLAYSASAHSESLAALLTWALASLGMVDPASIESLSVQLRRLALQATSGTSMPNVTSVFEQMDANTGSLGISPAFRSSSASLEDLVRAAVASRDSDRDGKISAEEFASEAVEEMSAPLQFSKLDRNNDSTVALRELLAEPLFVDDHTDSLRRGFQFADADKDGHLSGAELERWEARPFLHLLAEYPTARRGRVSDVREAQRPCAGVRSPQAPVAQLANELRDCGFVHVRPGWFGQDYVSRLWEAARDLPCQDHLAPHFGPFEKSAPFTSPQMQLWDLLKATVAPKPCCDLLSLAIRCFTCTELNATEEPLWRGPNIIAQNRYTVLVAMQTVTSPVLGLIPEMKHDRFVADERNSFCGGGVSSTGRHPPMRTRDGYTASFMAAGTVLIYDANLVQRPFCINDKWFLRYDLVAGTKPDRLSGLRSRAGVDLESGLELERQTAFQQVMLTAGLQDHSEL